MPSATPYARLWTIKALLLAAGEGTRLRPLTLTQPKPMVPVGGRPILEHLIALLRDHRIVDVAINLHYKPRAIVDHFGDGQDFGVRITYSHEERLLGSAGAAKRLAPSLDETFVVIYGDVLCALDLDDLVDLHRSRSAEATLALYEVSDPSRCGIVQTAPDGRVLRFVEKPAFDMGNLANAGVYVLEPSVLDRVPAEQPWDFGHDLFPALLRAGRPVYGRVASGYVLDIGSMERYQQAQADWAAGLVRRPVTA